MSSSDLLNNESDLRFVYESLSDDEKTLLIDIVDILKEQWIEIVYLSYLLRLINNSNELELFVKRNDIDSEELESLLEEIKDIIPDLLEHKKEAK